MSQILPRRLEISMNPVKEEFEKFLIERGYKQYTPKGEKSTVYDYSKRVDKVCEIENCTWAELANNIDRICDEYDIGGRKQKIGETSHRAVINALKQYRLFCNGKKQ